MFGEKKTEYMNGQEVSVWQTPKYQASKEAALAIIESGKYGLEEADFWILKNSGKTKMQYSGLIISHNGCLKVNDRLESKFDPTCVTMDKEGYRNYLVFTYCSAEQGIYEVGEVSNENLKNTYPYAMAFKRLFDRVVLKLSKLAYDNIYSDSESDEFVQRVEEPEQKESQYKVNVYDEDLKQWDSMRAQILEKVEMAVANKAAKKTYGKEFMDLDLNEMREVFEKVCA